MKIQFHSRVRQLLRYGIFLVCWVVLIGGALVVRGVADSDTEPSHSTDQPMSGDDSAGNLYHGIVAIPDPSNFMVGFEITEESCWVRLVRNSPNEFLVSSSLFDGQWPASNAKFGGGDFYLGDLANNEAVVLQLMEEHPVAFTHTSYDENGDVNYGISGTGDMFAECLDMEQ